MYISYLDVNKKFKSSVNLQYDLYNEEKIQQYIPTTDLCDVIKSFVLSVIKNGRKASFLAGPYGKGKSYLMLMITYIFSKKSNRKLFNEVIKKIKKIDSELAELIVEIDERKIVLLPVIINNGRFEDFNQNFLFALKNSLTDHKIFDVIPNSSFEECITLIEKWKNQNNSSFNIYNECTRKLKISTEELMIGLKNYDLKYYKKFEELFECITHGCKFNPLISTDIAEIYEDVSRKIEKYGYSGIFTIFDEFGTFLENQNGDFANRLFKIQSFAEKCESSSEMNQLHFCCITHKDVTLYSKDKFYLDEFEKIAGRFKHYRFDRSIEENYQIICSALVKKEGYNEIVSKKLDDNRQFYDYLKTLNIFSKDTDVDYILNNGFPFNPIALYSLIQVSEKIGQNERTLFTFLSDSDVNGFNYFINNNENDLLNVPLIYDYFENIIKDDNEYKHLYYKVASLKKLSIKQIEHDIFKTLAIINLIDDNVKYNGSIENIAASLSLDFQEAKSTIENLIRKNLLKRNINDNTIDFAVIANREINLLVDNVLVNRFSNVQLSDLLLKFDKNRYFISNKYNFENYMTRYYRVIYLEASKLDTLTDLNSLMNGEIADGVIINLINDNKMTKSRAKEIIKNNNIPNLIVRYCTNNISKYACDKLKRIFSAKYLLENEKNISETTLGILGIYVKDLSNELEKYLFDFYQNSISINSISNDTILSNCIYDSFTSFYNKTIIFNNELVNKNTLSSVIMKARNLVIDSIIKQENIDFGVTSAEATIKNSYLKSIKNDDSIIEVIKGWFINTNGENKKASDLIDILMKAPYGMRKGIIPFYIAQAISNLSINTEKNIETVLLYNDTQELEMNANNLNKVVYDPYKYYFCYTQIRKNKMIMFDKLMTIFKCNKEFDFTRNLKNLVLAIKNRVTNLAPIIIKSNKKENVLGLENIELQFKDIFLKHDINNYDVIFTELPKLLDCDYLFVGDKIENVLKMYEVRYTEFQNETILKVLKKFKIKGNTIKSSFDLWKSSNVFSDDVVLNNEEKKMYVTFKNIQFNDKDAINLLSFSVLNCSLDDWTEKKKNKFFDVLDNMIASIESFDADKKVKKEEFISEEKYEFSSLGKTLYSNIIDSIDEYGEALSNEEKALILKKILNDIVN